VQGGISWSTNDLSIKFWQTDYNILSNSGRIITVDKFLQACHTMYQDGILQCNSDILVVTPDNVAAGRNSLITTIKFWQRDYNILSSSGRIITVGNFPQACHATCQGKILQYNSDTLVVSPENIIYSSYRQEFVDHNLQEWWTLYHFMILHCKSLSGR